VALHRMLGRGTTCLVDKAMDQAIACAGDRSADAHDH
jgi:hypothetical protein